MRTFEYSSLVFPIFSDSFQDDTVEFGSDSNQTKKYSFFEHETSEISVRHYGRRPISSDDWCILSEYVSRLKNSYLLSLDIHIGSSAHNYISEVV